MILSKLDTVLNERKADDPERSYVASLYAGGINKILEKVGEEATEVIIAGKDHAIDSANPEALVKEVADLWFHTMVLLHQVDLDSGAVLDELGMRFGISGHEEKANRSAD